MMEPIRAGSQPSLDRGRPPAAGPLRPSNFPPIERFALTNGVPVLHCRLGGIPVATITVLLQAGGVHEESDRGGLASLTASLLESGAGDRSGSEIADRLELLGVQLSTGASWDLAHVDITGTTARIAAAADVTAAMLQSPTFPAPEIERLREEHLAAILQRRAEPRGLANEMLTRYVFSPETPFSRPLGGTTESLRGLVREDVVGFHSERYSPRTARIVVAGDLSLEDGREILEPRFGGWSAPAGTVRPVQVAPRAGTRQVILVHRPGSVQSEIRVGQVGVARTSPDYVPIAVMNTILGGAFTSRLNLNLRERHGFTYGVSSAFAMRRERGPFSIATAVQTEVTAPALAEIFTELAAMRAEPVSEPEIADARNYLAGVFPLSLQTTAGVAARLAEIALFDLPDDYFDRYRAQVLEVPAEEVLRVSREHLDPDSMAVVVVGDAEKVRPGIEALGLGSIQVVEPSEEP